MVIKGKIALITGAAGGIGFALAEVLGAGGATIVMTDIDETRLTSARNALLDRGIQAESVALDVTDHGAWISVVDQVESTLGPISLFFNNAGIYLPSMFLRDTPEKWRLTLDVNLNGAYYGLKTLLPRMLARGTPAYVVNTASVAGLTATPGVSAYCASKFGVLALSESLRSELKDTQVGISVLCPGPVSTDIVSNSHAKASAATGDLSTIQRRSKDLHGAGITPAQVAQATMEAMSRNEFYIFPSGDYDRKAIEDRMAGLLAAFSRIAD